MSVSSNMYKILVFCVLISYTLAGQLSSNTKSKFIQRSIKTDQNAIDWCPECVNGFDQLINAVLNVVLEYGVLGSCSDLCNLVANKTQSETIDILCTLGCSILGIKEFIKLIEDADLDPIYYCETIKLCPSR